MIESLNQLAEKHEKNELLNEADKYKGFVKKQFEEMKSPSRQFKYFWIRNALEFLKKIPGQDQSTKSRTLFLNYYYSLMRHWDDVADGDTPLPEGFTSRSEFIQNALDIVGNKNSSGLDGEARELADYCFRLGDSFGEDFRPQAEELLEHILYDAKRLGTNQLIEDKKDLDKHFDKEIAGCAQATRKIFKEDAKADEGIYPLARAVQTYYTLRDFEEDLKNGLINISEEEMKENGLSLEDLKDKENPKLKKWFVREAEIALGKMKDYDEKIGEYNLKTITVRTLDYAFKMKAKKFLQKVIKENK